MTKTIEIIVCDDHELFRNGILSTLANEPSVFVVGECDDGKACLSLLEEKDPDVILLDINMPEMDGIECLQAIRTKNQEVKVIALTQYEEKRFVKQMLKYGANGYIFKSTTKREILLALRTVMNGKTYLAQKAEEMFLDIDAPEAQNKLFPNLSNREIEIIRLLCHEFSTKQIAGELTISSHTVESHRSNIFKKVGANNLAGLVRWAVNNNLD